MTKIQLFEQELQDTSAIFKVLGHPARLAILKYLAETKTCISGDITEELPLSRATVHQHLTELKKLGLIKGTIDGVKTNYCLEPNSVKGIKHVIEIFLDLLEKGADESIC